MTCFAYVLDLDILGCLSVGFRSFTSKVILLSNFSFGLMHYGGLVHPTGLLIMHSHS